MPAYGNFILDKGAKPASAQVFTKFRAVKATANADEVTPVAASTDIVDGVAQFDVTVAEAGKGKRVSVRTQGITEWECGAAVTRGQRVMADTVGRCIAATGTGNRACGIARQTSTASGQRIAVMLDLPGEVL